MIIDILLCGLIFFAEFFFSNINDGNIYEKLIPFIIKIGLVIIISLIIIIFLIMRKKIMCLIGGISYFVISFSFWLYYSIYFGYIAFDEEEYNYNPDFDYYKLYILILNLSLIILRIGCCYYIKKIYKNLLFIEKYLFERDHTQFLEKIVDEIDVSIVTDNGTKLINEKENDNENEYEYEKEKENEKENDNENEKNEK